MKRKFRAVSQQQHSSGQEEPCRCKIRQNWDFLRYVLFGTSQSISKTSFDIILTKTVVKCCLNFLISIHSHTNFKILLTISRFNCWCSCSVLPEHWRSCTIFFVCFFHAQVAAFFTSCPRSAYTISFVYLLSFKGCLFVALSWICWTLVSYHFAALSIRRYVVLYCVIRSSFRDVVWVT